MYIKSLGDLILELRDPNNLDKITEINITDITKISEEHLTMEYDFLSQMFGIISILSAYAQNAEAKVKFELETLMAQLDVTKRLELKNNEDKVTESMIQTAIKNDSRYQQLFESWLDIRKKHLILTKIEGSLLLKKDMLISLAADIRASNR